MKCQNCGRELKNGARFCIGCGAHHDENGQLIQENQNKMDYNKTMMASDFERSRGSQNDYNKTMMTGDTGFHQYQGEIEHGYSRQFDTHNNEYYEDNEKKDNREKKKISPIMIICPLIIIIALGYSFINGRNKKNIEKNKEIKKETTIINEEQKIIVATPAVAIATNSVSNNKIHLEGYWSADANYFYINGEMQKGIWINDEYYVGDDGKKVVNAWIDNKYYVDETGKKSKNKWIEFIFQSSDGQKKGFYYVGDDGLKVTNKKVDGRYLNEAGCYWPELSEIEQYDEKKTEKIEIENNEEKKAEESVAIKETNKQVETIVAQETNRVSFSLNKESVGTYTNSIDNIAPIETTIFKLESNGENIAYQKNTLLFPEKKITRFDDLQIIDTRYPNLATAINEWNSNREKEGILIGETIIDDDVSKTYDLEIGRNDKGVFSVCEVKTKHDKNIAYDIKKHGHTWDSHSGQELTLNDIFDGDDKYVEFAKKVLTKLKSYKSSIDEEIYEEIINGEETSVLEYCTWYMENKGISIIFNSNQISFSQTGGITFTMTYSESGNNINKLLLKKYRK